MILYLALAWRSIWRNKRRSLISMSSVLFAAVIAMAMRSMQLGFYARSIDNIVSFYTGYLQIHADGFWEKQNLDHSMGAPDSVAAIIGRVPHVTCTTPRLESFALVSAGNVTDGAQVIGIDPQMENRLTGLEKKLSAGRYLGDDDTGILLAAGLANHLGLGVGDTVIVLGSGYHGVSAAGRFEILGTVEYPTPELNSGMCYLALREAQEFFGAPGRATSLAVMLDGPKYLDRVKSALAQKLDSRYEVISWKTMMPDLVEYIQVDNASGIIMLLLIYVVVGFGILGTVLMMTMERTREFGVMIAVGMRRGVIRAMILLESVILTLVGAVAGMVLSVPLLAWLRAHPIELGGQMADAIRSYGFQPILPFSLAPSIFFWQTVTVVAIALVAALYPILRVSRLDPVRAIGRGQ